MRTRLRHAAALGAVVIMFGSPWIPGWVPASASPPPSTPARATPGPVFRWPLDGTPRPVRRFNPPPQPWLPGHRGVDLAGEPGATVRAAGAGTVLFAGLVAGRPVVTVGHPAGLRTTYEPVHPDVHPGDVVAAGAPLGVLLAGHPGCPTAPQRPAPRRPAGDCLHWGLRRGAEYLDPLALLGLGPVRLLPTSLPAASETVTTWPVGVPAREPVGVPAAWPVGVPAAAPDGVERRAGWAACRCGQRTGGTRSAPGQQRRQPDGQPLVLVGGVVDLSTEP